MANVVVNNASSGAGWAIFTGKQGKTVVFAYNARDFAAGPGDASTAVVDGTGTGGD